MKVIEKEEAPDLSIRGKSETEENVLENVTTGGSHHDTASVSYEQHAFEVDDQEKLPDEGRFPAERHTADLADDPQDEHDEVMQKFVEYAEQNKVLGDIRKEITEWIVEQIRLMKGKPDWDVLRTNATGRFASAVALVNKGRPAGERLAVPSYMPYQMVSAILLEIQSIRRIGSPQIPRGEEPLGWYVEDGPDEGIYSMSEKFFTSKIRKLEDALSAYERREALSILQNTALRVDVSRDPDLVAVGNGICGYMDNSFRPFDPSYVFTSKIEFDFPDVEEVEHPVMYLSNGKRFYIEDAIRQIADDDPEIEQVIWEMIAAAVRSNRMWKMSYFLIGPGGNGKSTILKLIRNLVGAARVAELQLRDFSHEFMISKLINASLVIGDENTTDLYLDDSANFKKSVTGEPLLLNRKNRDPINYQYRGLILQSFNKMPRTRDKTAGLYRRIIMVPFNRSFKDSKFPEINDEFVDDPELLRYILHKIMRKMPKFQKLTKPAAGQALMEKFKMSNDPVRLFWDTFKDRFQWDMLPWKYIYALYKQWMYEENPKGKTLSKENVQESFAEILENDEDWAIFKKQTSIKDMMDEYEPLIVEYRVTPLWDTYSTDHILEEGFTDYEGRKTKREKTAKFWARQMFGDDKGRVYSGIIRKNRVS